MFDRKAVTVGNKNIGIAALKRTTGLTSAVSWAKQLTGGVK